MIYVCLIDGCSRVLLTSSRMLFRFESWVEILVLLSSSLMFCIRANASLAVPLTSEAASLASLMSAPISSKQNNNTMSFFRQDKTRLDKFTQKRYLEEC